MDSVQKKVDSNRTKLIVKNTIALYLRMAITMLIGLYTSRVVLNVLGVEDYGIYNVVGGVVAMFSILTNSMASSVSRFLTFEQGKRDKGCERIVFSMSMNVMALMAVVVFFVTEIVGVWFLNVHMNIPNERLIAANWVMQCCILSFIANLLIVPYNASIIAHERMSIYAYISIWDAIAKLLIVFALYQSPFDKLKSYAVLLLLINTITMFFYWLYCRRHFVECRYMFVKEEKLFRKMFSFAGWAFLGDGAWTLNTQGVSILINMFFGVVLNAARGIAFTVDNAIQGFVRNFMTALNPQIIKSYASGDLEYMHRLIILGSKFSFFLMLFFFIPLELEMPRLLTLWLKIVPDYAVVFTRITLASSLCFVLGNTLITAISATGNIRIYEVIMGGLALSIFPMTWLAFLLGASPVAAYVIYLFVFICMTFVRVFIASKKVGLSWHRYMSDVIFKALTVMALSFVLPSVCYVMMNDSLWRFLTIVMAAPINTVIIVYWVGMNSSERQTISGMFWWRKQK
ncbi:MAG: oligosaccharide flippase family protein [Prevotella sp.]